MDYTPLVYKYALSDLIKEPVKWSESQTQLSRFDQMLREAWDNAVKEGLFRYTLKDCVYQKLDLKQGENGPSLPAVAQLNPQRAFNRRKRETFASMNDPFDITKFNFTKINSREILLAIIAENQSDTTSDGKTDCNLSDSNHKLLINISPIDYGHILFVPYLNSCLPQRITKDSLILAFDVVQCSSQPSFRLSFNSLHAWASINHLHFHGMYCNCELFADVLPADNHIKGSCYLLDCSSPLPAFVFTIPTEFESRKKIATEITLITDYLHSICIPYNLVLTRGIIQRKNNEQDKTWTFRALLFPRTSTKDLQPSPTFDVACIEVAGHFPIKEKGCFDSLTAKEAVKTLRNAALPDELFQDIVERVKVML